MVMCAAELKRASATGIWFYGVSAVISLRCKVFIACV
jgi:hypothetical protein